MGTSNAPMDEVHACVDRSPKRHFITQHAVAIHKSFDDPYGAVVIIEVLPFTEVTDHLAEIVGSVTKLRQLPVEEEKFISFSMLLQLCRWDIG